MAEGYTFKVDIDGVEKTFSFGPETLHIQQQCKLAYTQAYAFYFKNGTMTKGQALEIAKQNGVLDDEWQKRVDIAVLEIAKTTSQLTTEKAKKRKNKQKISELVQTIKKLRDSYDALLGRHTGVILPTCENLAENRELELCVVLRLLNEDGSRVFKDHADMVARYDESLTQIALEHMMYMRAGLPFQLNGLYEEDTVDSKG